MPKVALSPENDFGCLRALWPLGDRQRKVRKGGGGGREVKRRKGRGEEERLRGRREGRGKEREGEDELRRAKWREGEGKRGRGLDIRQIRRVVHHGVRLKNSRKSDSKKRAGSPSIYIESAVIIHQPMSRRKVRLKAQYAFS